jgi:hypothetical protein
MASKWQHRISNVDPETRTGDCAHCGRVRVVYKKTKDRWVCGPAKMAQKRKDEIKRKFGITCKEYDAMYERQGGKCATCGLHQSKQKKRMNVDHDHKTGRVRGLLCHNCNVVLGLVNDNPKTMQKMLHYLG